MRSALIVSLIVLLALAVQPAHAYFNMTYLNVTVVPQLNGSAYVTETYYLYITGPSVYQYNSYRQAINFTISSWQQALGVSGLTEHIINPSSSLYDFKFLPGPPQYSGTTATAEILMSYYVNNVTSINETAPRRFEYSFNSYVFNFAHTASGTALPANTRLNIIIPKEAKVVSVYPLPDYPSTGFIGNYTGKTEFSWYSQEPLSKFVFIYIVPQSLGDEVLSYFSNLYNRYSVLLYVLLAILVVGVVAYLYFKVVRV
ncbi:MAG: hypothetical protein ACP5K9_02840 [Candidatus Micrarchaeia archaeon]